MSEWAQNRQRLLLFIGVSLLAAFAVIILVPVLYQTPSCADKKQNQGEEGIDCGGSCAYLCADVARPLSVRFVQGIVQSGRADAIAYIDNRNDAALDDAAYTIEFYDASRVLLGTKQGTIDMPPNATVPVFVPGVTTGVADVAQAFLLFDTATLRWFRAPEKDTPPKIIETRIDETNARVTAVIENSGVRPMTNTKFVITIFGPSGNIIAASQTVVPLIVSQGTAEAVFTWNEPFSDVPARIDVIPVPVVEAP